MGEIKPKGPKGRAAAAKAGETGTRSPADPGDKFGDKPSGYFHVKGLPWFKYPVNNHHLIIQDRINLRHNDSSVSKVTSVSVIPRLSIRLLSLAIPAWRQRVRVPTLALSIEPTPTPRPRLGPLGFECSQHRQTLCPSVDGIRSKALRPFGVQ